MEDDICPDCESFHIEGIDPAPAVGTVSFACSCYRDIEPRMFCARHYEWRMGRFTCPDHGDV